MNKKICMLLSNPFTHDNRVYREAKTLVEAGYDLTIICPKCGKDLPTEENINGIKVKRVLSCYLPFFPLNLFEYRECRLFLRMAAQEHADVYHSHDFDTLIYGYLCSMKNKAKLIYDSHEYWQDKSSYINSFSFKSFVCKKYLFFEKVFIKRADYVITVSNGIADLLKKMFKLKSKPVVLRNVPLLEGFGGKDHSTSSRNKKITIIYLGALIENRGLEKIISYVNDSKEDVILKLVGYGDLACKLEKINYNKEKIKFFPAVPADEVWGIISQADVGIIPTQDTSISHRFSLPNKLFDYILAGVPVIASDLPEISTIVKEYKVGETFNISSEAEFTKALAKLLKNLKTYTLNTKHARRYLNWEQESQKLLQLYGELF